ncbi:lipid-A-disaccharide synthase [Seohaeicola zhoushanensis]|uniref:Lipid-A-disaccharide synthase n=1 Tax=Seohaeicola zhoushanensis TaxID=1569283 RepID=A0A8J3GY15_9RHOB|nr:lipid-A-disaccharide synthase [Seohaeicola zhoushanensis]GHF56061.1 lipid-A-disaccharide synthase [Seohaeicola zhoushanensis]
MKVFLVAGEPSGDRLGGALMAGLRQLVPDVEFDGIGGTQMMAQGLVSRFPMDELSVMGLAEILPKYFHLKRRIRETAEAVLDTRPDVLITIDSPDFCLRVARLVKARSAIRTVHYVAPTVWAWRPGRAAKMAEVIDHVLALFPFEPPLMTAAGMDCDFVGHPVVAEPQATQQEIEGFRATAGVDGDFLLVLPGSRRGEVARLSPIFGETLQRFLAPRPQLRVVVPAAGPVAGLVREAVATWPGDPVVIDPAETALKRAAFAAAPLALAASGTVSLELAAARTPMVIAYDMSWLSRQIISRMLLVDTVTLVNLVSETRTVPEFIGANCRPERIAEGLAQVFDAPEAQTEAMALTMQRLGLGGEPPGLRAARAVLSRL